MKVAVVYDAENNEEKKMVDAVFTAVSTKFDAEKVVFGDNFIEKIKKFDFVFNLSTHGGRETRQIYVPALLDLLKIPYTSANAYTHSICMNKNITKLVLKQNGIPTPNFFDSNAYDGKAKFIVKPSMEGSAKGIEKDSVVSGIEKIENRIRQIEEEFKQPAVAEEFIEGKELSVGIIGNGEKIKVLPILEIDFSRLPEGLEKFYSYRVKHLYAKETNYICPANISEKVKEEIEQYAIKVFKVLGLRDYARMDIRLKDDKPYFIEVNSMPQLVPVYSDITKMGEAAGYSYNEFILTIMDSSLERWGLI
jgi:D-alanine-D-alanine ligase